jgi:hypothetical protein
MLGRLDGDPEFARRQSGLSSAARRKSVAAGSPVIAWQAAGRAVRGAWTLVSYRLRAPDFKVKGTAAKPFSEEENGCLDLLRFPERTLPDRCHAPSTLQKRGANGTVPGDICSKLRLPELQASRWGGGIAATLMAMPETAMHEDDRLAFRKHEIWSSHDSFRMQPVPEAARMERPPKSQFRLRVLSPDPGHHPGAGLLVYGIRHVGPGFRPGTRYTPAERVSSGV